MTTRHALERLLALRRQRTRLAERELAAERARCRDLARETQRFDTARQRLAHTAQQQEQARFDTAAGRPLSAAETLAWQQSRAEQAALQAALAQRQQRCQQAARLAHQREQTQRGEWARCRQRQQALAQLQADQQRRDTRAAECLAELEHEEGHGGREPRP
ncbi:hypothetical protein [Salinicola endophyticus]|uniref:Type III secretion protein n=1 Tax=Salinicola endophyticus TaxID=1949083 RepID=A0AB74U6D4_9GAMM